MNRGIAPLDPTSDVGQFRLLSGDVDYKPLDPPEAGFGDYTLWSDDQILALIAVGGGIPRGIANAYAQLAASTQAATIKTDDLNFSGKAEVDKWLALAARWEAVADRDDSRAVDDYFDIVTVGGERHRHPEGSPWSAGWCC